MCSILLAKPNMNDYQTQEANLGGAHPCSLYKIYIKTERACLNTFPGTKRTVENTTQSGVFLMNFDVFGKWSYTILSVCYIFTIKTKTKGKTER